MYLYGTHSRCPPVIRAIRVAVANQPRMMRDLIAMSLAQEEDVEVVAQIGEEAEIPRLIEEIQPEFLIVSIDARRFGPLAREDMLQRHPELQIIALASDGNSFTLFSASDGVRSMTYREAEAEILDVLRSNCRMKAG
jgi:DNA-binding NarL/FixJ family response regulator